MKNTIEHYSLIILHSTTIKYSVDVHLVDE